MPASNPTAVIAECIEKSKATDDPELIGEYIAEALATLQIEESEEDAFNMLGSAMKSPKRRQRRLPLVVAAD